MDLTRITSDMSELDQFAQTVAAFLSFAEAKPTLPDVDVILAVRHLKALLAGIEPLFEIPYETGPDAPDCPAEVKKAVAVRFSHLPINTYLMVFDPNALESKDELVHGMITDDLMDIYGDLWPGYQLYLKGHSGAALWEWTFLYGIHWGQHATSALYALDSYRRDNYLFSSQSA